MAALNEQLLTFWARCVSPCPTVLFVGALGNDIVEAVGLVPFWRAYMYTFPVVSSFVQQI